LEYIFIGLAPSSEVLLLVAKQADSPNRAISSDIVFMVLSLISVDILNTDSRMDGA
tara:strand:+ start:74 stop:241 length:168 start_codon:yes stop_codon:yes gene_type:complete